MSEIITYGTCNPEFNKVRDEFEKNFRERNEVGASVCVIHNGDTVVDLWGGVADQDTGQPWEENTKSVVWSSTKGMTSMCAHVLADRGQLDFDAPVITYWPKFGQNGKEKTTVGQLLSHQSGVSVITSRIPPGGVYDWDLMVSLIEKQAPQFEPGSRVGYAALVSGWLVGEVVRRVSGSSLGTFFKNEIAEPLAADCWIGLPEERESETARMILPERELFDLSLPEYEAARELFTNSGGYMDMVPVANGPPAFDSCEAHAAEIGGGGGITNGRGLARIYAPWANGGVYQGVQLVDTDTIVRAGSVVSAISTDFLLRYPVRFSLGFQKSWYDIAVPDSKMILSEAAFGHGGYGGSLGFADPDANISFGYVMNRMGSGSTMFDRAQMQVDAVYRALGYQSNASGIWHK